MPRQLSANEYSPPNAHGPKLEFVPGALIAELKAIVNIPLSSNYTTALYSADGFYDFVLGLTSSQAGAINFLRYIDDAGTVLVDSTAPTQAIVAATPEVFKITDGVPFAAFKVQVTNTSGTTAAVLTNIAALISAH
jgi:hypothetical protein